MRSFLSRRCPIDTTYALRDGEAGNIVGAFASVGEAPDVVRVLLADYGPGYETDLNLRCRDGSGASRVIAIGEQLVEGNQIVVDDPRRVVVTDGDANANA